MTTINEEQLEQFVHQAVGDMGAAISGLLLHLGDRLGLYRAMAGAGPLTSADLAERTGTAERYVREWLSNQAAGGYVSYDPDGQTYELPPEQAMVVADEDSPVFLGGAFESIAGCYSDHERFVDAFRTRRRHRLGRARPPAVRRHAAAVPAGLRRPPDVGVAAGARRRRGKLRDGVSVADVGCGLGASTIIMAQAFPRSTFVGFDYHEPSIEAARKAAVRGRRAPTGCGSRWRRRRTSRAPATTWCACSTACTTWATRSAPPGGSGRPSPTDGTAAGGRAVRRRPAGGQPDAGRTDLLRPVHGRLHAGVAGPGRRAGARARRPGSGRLTAVLHEAGLHPRPAGHGDAVQPHSGGPTIGVAPRSARAASPAARSSPPASTRVRAHW